MTRGPYETWAITLRAPFIALFRRLTERRSLMEIYREVTK